MEGLSVFMSALLTYFRVIVTRQGLAAKGKNASPPARRRHRTPAPAHGAGRTLQAEAPRQAQAETSPRQESSRRVPCPSSRSTSAKDTSGSTARSCRGPTRRCTCSPTACTTAPACSRASVPMAARSSSRPSIPSGCTSPPSILDFEIPYSVAELDAAKQKVLELNAMKDAYVRPVAWRGSEMMAVSAQHSTIHVAIAVWDWPSMFDVETEDEGHQARHGRLPPPRPDDRAVGRQGGRPLHDLHDLQAPRREEGLRRRADARLAGPRRRVHRRQRVLHPRRRRSTRPSPTASSTASPAGPRSTSPSGAAST